MSENNSSDPPTASNTDSTQPGKIAKPRPDFPLTPHRAGYWCKRILGKLYYFGERWKPGDQAAAWAAADGALADYNRQKSLHDGRKPRADADGFRVKDAVNVFLTHKKARLDNGELSPQTFAKYNGVTDEVIAHFGKSRLVADLDPEDFAALRAKLAKKCGPYRLADTIQHVRSIFKLAFDDGLMDKPVRFGRGFDRPTKNALRLHKAEQGVKLFSADEVRRIIAIAGKQMKAMVLLGINCGFGNSDCGALPLSALDLDRGWIDFPRPKTGIPRRCPLWPETVAALREVLATRPEPKHEEADQLVFVTKYGQSWAKETADNPITKEMRKLLNALGIEGRRNFYTLRHAFRTVADESKDQPACDFIMGHQSTHMSTLYRETISDERLRAVVDHVHDWLFVGEKKTT